MVFSLCEVCVGCEEVGVGVGVTLQWLAEVDVTWTALFCRDGRFKSSSRLTNRLIFIHLNCYANDTD